MIFSKEERFGKEAEIAYVNMATSFKQWVEQAVRVLRNDIWGDSFEPYIDQYLHIIRTVIAYPMHQLNDRIPKLVNYCTYTDKAMTCYVERCCNIERLFLRLLEGNKSGCTLEVFRFLLDRWEAAYLMVGFCWKLDLAAAKGVDVPLVIAGAGTRALARKEREKEEIAEFLFTKVEHPNRKNMTTAAIKLFRELANLNRCFSRKLDFEECRAVSRRIGQWEIACENLTDELDMCPHPAHTQALASAGMAYLTCMRAQVAELSQHTIRHSFGHAIPGQRCWTDEKLEEVSRDMWRALKALMVANVEDYEMCPENEDSEEEEP